MGGDDEEGLPALPMLDDKDFLPEPGSINDYAYRVGELFREIEDRFGRAEAQRIFSRYSKDHRIPLHVFKKLEVLRLYYRMKPWRNKLALAHKLTEANKKQPGRYGKGSTDVHTMRTYIDRAVKETERRNPWLLLGRGETPSSLLFLLRGRGRHKAKPKPKPK